MLQEPNPYTTDQREITWSCELGDFLEFLQKAKPGTEFIYHIGFTLTATPLSREYKKLAHSAAIMGKVYLFQRRVSPFKYKYLMVKASYVPKKLLPYTEKQRIEVNPKLKGSYHHVRTINSVNS